MRIFFASPVRGVTDEYKAGLDAKVAALEAEGHVVHYPSRDTRQDGDDYGLRICCQNRDAIAEADVVFVAWDGKSQGVLFDLGMAFALDKPVRVVEGYMPPRTPSKSFQNMIHLWELTK
jgi:nucleoside 2-deoxyribosyltransferase